MDPGHKAQEGNLVVAERVGPETYRLICPARYFRMPSP